MTNSDDVTSSLDDEFCVNLFEAEQEIDEGYGLTPTSTMAKKLMGQKMSKEQMAHVAARTAQEVWQSASCVQYVFKDGSSLFVACLGATMRAT